jgi:hypothetical protein
MSDKANKYQSRENRTTIRKILMEEWDPIGVQGISGAEGEYDAYVGKVYVILMQECASVQAITRYLLNTATDRMGLVLTPDLAKRSEYTAAKLASCAPYFETH